MKKICLILTMLLLLFVDSSSIAFAYDSVQERKDCSIDVKVHYGEEAVNGGTLTAVRVGYVEEEDGNYCFRRVIDDVHLTEVQTKEAIKQALDFYETNPEKEAFSAQTVEVKEGTVIFSELSTGLYLILQEEAAKGYSKLTPFLVSVPYMSEGEYVYNITATVKSELEREPETTVAPEPLPGETLPQTGQMNWPVPILCVCGLMLFVFGWYLCFGGKRDSYEK